MEVAIVVASFSKFIDMRITIFSRSRSDKSSWCVHRIYSQDCEQSRWNWVKSWLFSQVVTRVQ